MITVQNLTKYYGQKAILDGLSFEVATGHVVGIIGPNGSGKSTLLKLVSGVEPKSSGTILLAGKPVEAYSRKELAKRLSVLQQEALPPLGFTVREVVEMGRFPYQNWLGEEVGGDDGLIDQIMERLCILPLAKRTLERLSGGERQRVALAKAMAQEPKLLLLDEPTTYLDIGFQIQMMDYIRNWQREHKLTVLAVLHDLNIAAQYCDRVIVLKDGGIVADGVPREVFTRSLIQEVYGASATIISHPVSGVPQVLLQPEAMSELPAQIRKI
jgi:iron complex transport system ATP-binding protein